MPLDRVFIDTNILVSAAVFTGNERTLIDLALQGQFRALLSNYVIQEARRVVGVKFPPSATRLEYLLEAMDYELVPGPPPSLSSFAGSIVRDVGDVAVLAAILLAKPDVALTGDKDLLTDEVRAIAPVRTCADYLRSLTAES